MAGFDFSPIGLGIDAISSIAGLLGASRAQKQAQERRDSIISQMKAANAQEYLDVQTGNERSLAARSGGLNAGLESTGRSLGAANAAAGVTNSSAVGGSLALGAQGIQQALASYKLRNQMQEGQLLAHQQQGLLGVEMGAANSDLGYARDQYQGSVDAFGNVVGMAGQFFGAPGAGGGMPNDGVLQGTPTSAGGGVSSADAGMLTTPSFPPITLGQDTRLAQSVNPLQAWLQKRTQQNRKMVGGMDARTMGPMVNGMQGAALPAI